MEGMCSRYLLPDEGTILRAATNIEGMRTLKNGRVSEWWDANVRCISQNNFPLHQTAQILGVAAKGSQPLYICARIASYSIERYYNEGQYEKAAEA